MTKQREAQSVRWRNISVFLLLTFGLAWIPFLVVAASHLTPAAVALILLPLQFAPAIAAFLVRGPLFREGFADSGIRLHLNRQSLSSYGLACVVVPLVLVVAGTLGLTLHLTTWAPDVSQAASALPIQEIPLPSNLAGIVALVLGVSIVGALVTFGEEFGWRGYLLPRLMPLGQNRAILLSGVIWACWHLPLNLVYGANGGLLGFPFWLVWIVGLGVVLGWLRLRAQSVWPAAIMHSQVDVLPRLEGVLLAATPTDPVFIIFQVLMMLIGLVLALRGALTHWWLRQAGGQMKPA